MGRLVNSLCFFFRVCVCVCVCVCMCVCVYYCIVYAVFFHLTTIAAVGKVDTNRLFARSRHQTYVDSHWRQNIGWGLLPRRFYVVQRKSRCHEFATFHDSQRRVHESTVQARKIHNLGADVHAATYIKLTFCHAWIAPDLSIRLAAFPPQAIRKDRQHLHATTTSCCACPLHLLVVVSS